MKTHGHKKKNSMHGCSESIIRNSPVATIQCPSTDEQVNNMFPHTGEYFSTLKKDDVLTGATNMDEPWKHDAQWMKPDPRNHILYDSISMPCPELAIP